MYVSVCVGSLRSYKFKQNSDDILKKLQPM